MTYSEINNIIVVAYRGPHNYYNMYKDLIMLFTDYEDCKNCQI